MTSSLRVWWYVSTWQDGEGDSNRRYVKWPAWSWGALWKLIFFSRWRRGNTKLTNTHREYLFPDTSRGSLEENIPGSSLQVPPLQTHVYRWRGLWPFYLRWLFQRNKLPGKSKPKAERAYCIAWFFFVFFFLNIPLYSKLHQENIFAVSQGSLFRDAELIFFPCWVRRTNFPMLNNICIALYSLQNIFTSTVLFASHNSLWIAKLLLTLYKWVWWRAEGPVSQASKSFWVRIKELWTSLFWFLCSVCWHVAGFLLEVLAGSSIYVSGEMDIAPGEDT